MKLSTALIGAGAIAGGYDEKKTGPGVFTHAGAYKAHGGFALATVCDADARRAEAFRKRWGFAATAELGAVLGRWHDVVSVCTPDKSHFDITKRLLSARCCGTIFVEKPAALELSEIRELISLSARSKIPVIVNFQRRLEPAHAALKGLIDRRAKDLLAVNAYYIKGLDHIGTTMVDTLCSLCGYPEAVLAYNEVPNREVGETTVEFILFFENFNATVKTIDSKSRRYSYHIFELDFLFADQRASLIDNSRLLRRTPVGGFAYSGVRALAESESRLSKTGFEVSMPAAASYVHDVASGRRVHAINRLESSYNDKIIIDAVRRSLQLGRRVAFRRSAWKK